MDPLAGSYFVEALTDEIEARAWELISEVAAGEGNLLHPIKEALRAGASIGEVCGAMRDVFGEYKGGAFF